ncbi:hypothetical protein MBLNU230_g5839t1 [Neophaeotheca triangularis]
MHLFSTLTATLPAALQTLQTPSTTTLPFAPPKQLVPIPGIAFDPETTAATTLKPIVHDTTAREKEQEEEAKGRFYMCPYDQWRGRCVNYEVPLGACVTVPEGGRIAVGSAGPDHGLECLVYTEFSCDGEPAGPVTFPGFADIAQTELPREWVGWVCQKQGGGK